MSPTAITGTPFGPIAFRGNGSMGPRGGRALPDYLPRTSVKTLAMSRPPTTRKPTTASPPSIRVSSPQQTERRHDSEDVRGERPGTEHDSSSCSVPHEREG